MGSGIVGKFHGRLSVALKVFGHGFCHRGIPLHIRDFQGLNGTDQLIARVIIFRFHRKKILLIDPNKIITEAEVKLHPVFENEQAVLVPYDNLRDAYRLLIKLARRDIGLSLAVLSRKYLAEFLTPTLQMSKVPILKNKSF